LESIDRLAGSKHSRSALIERVLRRYLRDRAKSALQARDLERINKAADRLNREAAEVLDLPGIRRIMTANEFRRMALSFPETEERAHMDHPDFRVGGKIFATLGYPEDGWAMVKLTPIEQEMFVKAHPTVFNPCNGAWGRRGATNVQLKAARKQVMRRALLAAWNLTAPDHMR